MSYEWCPPRAVWTAFVAHAQQEHVSSRNSCTPCTFLFAGKAFQPTVLRMPRGSICLTFKGFWPSKRPFDGFWDTTNITLWGMWIRARHCQVCCSSRACGSTACPFTRHLAASRFDKITGQHHVWILRTTMVALKN